MDPNDTPLVITREELVGSYLFGVNLTDDAGNSYPDAMFDLWIRSAQEFIEENADVVLAPRDIVGEKHDYWRQDFTQFGFLNLNYSPIIDVTRLTLQYPGAAATVTFPLDWITWSDDGSNRVQLIPGFQSGGSVAITSNGIFLPLLTSGMDYVPDVFRVDYRAGLAAPPAIVKHAVGLKASIDILNIAGDLLVGAGIASKSVGVGGFHSSINTTSSATNSGYGSRIIQYEKQLKDLMPTIVRKYGHAPRMTAI